MTDEKGGWQEFYNPRNSFLEKYKNQLVIVIGKGKSKVIYITDEVMKRLDHPMRIRILTRGNNIAFANSHGDDGYSVQVNERSKLPFISATALIKQYNLVSGAYTAHFESGMVVFDIMQEPSRL